MSQRECGNCTACCEGWLDANINGQLLSPGFACRHLCSTGCGIYPDRPKDPCQNFECAWLQEGSALPDHMRPDLCGAIVVTDHDWNGWKTIRAVVVGESIPPETLDWLKAHAQETRLPLIFRENRKKGGGYEKKPHLGFGPPAFVEQVKTSLNKDDIYLGSARAPGG